MRSRLGAVDLNLLVVLDALLSEESVTGAAARLSVTQSAASHALNRLRGHFEDRLLVRQGSRMTVTPLGEQLRPRVRETLGTLEQLFTSRSEFEPARSTRRFLLLASDYAQAVVLPGLIKRLREEAPGVDLAVRTSREPERAVAARDASLMIGPIRDMVPALMRQRLFADHLVCVARRGHPALEGTLTLERYASARHALVSPRGLPGGIVDRELRGIGLERRVAVELPHFLIAPILVAASDLLLTIPARLAAILAKSSDLSIAPLPLRAPPIDFVQLWHRSDHDDPGHAWLRSRIAESAKEGHSANG